MPHPVVAIVGAPNVGKSTLFNRLLGRRQAIVADQPGVTRDRLMSDCELNGRSVTLVDTGGVVTGPRDDLGRRVRAEALKAIEAADVIVYVIDSRAGLTGSDEHVATLLRESGRPIIPVANKIDSRGQEGYQFEMYRLGLGDVVPVSAEQGRGIDDLTDAIVARLPQSAPVASTVGVPLAIIGRPNVGKSSLFNRIIREERSVVSEVPGTTRDPVDATFMLGDTLYRILDTAGIRRRTAGAGEVEWVSVLKARQALESSEIVIALVDGVEGVQHQDRALLGLVTDSHKPSVLAVNKIDLLDPGGPSAEARAATIREELRFSRHVPAVPLSAKTGKGLGTLLKTLAQVREQSLRRFATTDLNRALKAVIAEKHPPADGGREVRFHYISQAPGAPPCFVVFGNGRRVDPAYRRYMEGRLRERLGLDLSPITLLFRRRKDSR